MTVQIMLVRHAAHDEIGHVLSGRRTDVPLNDLGRSEAGRLAHGLAGRVIAGIWTSPQRRTRETASAIGECVGIQPVVADALDEVDFGAWAGRSFAELEQDARWQDWNDARDRACPPGGETMAAAVARITGFLDGIAADDGAPLLCVSHCDMIRGAVAHYLGLGLDRLLTFDCDPASVSTLTVGQWGGRVNRLNEVCG